MSEKEAGAVAAAPAPDTFENEDSEEPPEPPRASVDLDNLPIELIGLTDSFIESLQAKVHPTPLSVDALATLFQDFYATASTHIATHLAALATRQSREQATAAAAAAAAAAHATRPSAASILRAKAASIGGRDRTKTTPTTPPPPAARAAEAEQQMITAAELADRKRQRRALEVKRSLMEEAVERRLCEGIYDRIYRHRSTQDEAQDDKLRSKTAALAVVGIGPADLGVDLGVDLLKESKTKAGAEAEVQAWLEPARREIVRMNQTHYPLGKLNRLKAAHKAIVDTLAHFHPSSSADEIMPMLIYTLITLPPERLNVVSDLHFVQRFRWAPKMDGEAAYCLTNLEAAISFLDTVDLSTLRADEAPSGPVKTTADPETPKTETFPPYFGPTTATPATAELSDGQATGSVAEPAGTAAGTAAGDGLRATVRLHNRRLSDLVNTPAAALSTASDAVLNTFSAADQGLKTIGNSLEGSYRLFFGTMAGRAGSSGSGSEHGSNGASAAVPKTLDEARKFISTPPPADDEEPLEAHRLSPAAVQPAVSAVQPTPQPTPPSTHPSTQPLPPLQPTKSRRDDKLLTVVGGRKTSASRDHSADSARSAASSRRVAFADDDAGAAGAAANNPALMDSVRSLGSSLNPMSRLGSIGGFRGFGRAVSASAVPQHDKAVLDGGDLATAFPDLAAALPPKGQVAPPIKRFMEVHNAADLRISEVAVLLREYQRLATALKEMGGFRE